MTENTQIDFRFLAEPTDVNFGGKVHGGMVMKWIDQASYACAAQWSKRYCVTVSANAIRFIRPILVGQMVHLNARIVHTGKTSMHCYVSVQAGDPKDANMVVTNRCFISFIAMDEAGYPVPVPAFTPETDEDKRLEKLAIEAKSLARQIDQDFEQTFGEI